MLVASFCLFVGVQFMFEYRSVSISPTSRLNADSSRRQGRGSEERNSEKLLGFIRAHQSVNLSRTQSRFSISDKKTRSIAK